MNTIGRKDKIDLPDLDLINIEAKIDTGAFGSALHCHHIEIIDEGDKKYLTFTLLDPSHSDFTEKIFKFDEYNDTVVKNSSGGIEHRYTIKTKLIIFGQSYLVEFSLTNRQNMKSPILLGRKFLSKKFVVDVRKKNISFKQKS